MGGRGSEDSTPVSVLVPPSTTLCRNLFPTPVFLSLAPRTVRFLGSGDRDIGKSCRKRFIGPLVEWKRKGTGCPPGTLRHTLGLVSRLLHVRRALRPVGDRVRSEGLPVTVEVGVGRDVERPTASGTVQEWTTETQDTRRVVANHVVGVVVSVVDYKGLVKGSGPRLGNTEKCK